MFHPGTGVLFHGNHPAVEVPNDVQSAAEIRSNSFISRERYGQCENKNNVKTRKNNKAQIATDGKLFEVYKYHNSYFWP